MPASVIGMVLLFIGLCTKVVKLEQVEGLGNSLSTVITFLFVPSGISLVNSLDYATIWRSNCFVILVATLALLATTGWTGAFLLHMKDARKEKEPAATKKAKGEVRASVGIIISLAVFGIGTWLFKKQRFFLFTPLFVAMILGVVVLKVTGISYEQYNEGGKYISFFLEPATVAFAIPLYKRETC